MRPIEPLGGATHLYAANQPEYQPLPVRQCNVLFEGLAVPAVTSEWELSAAELELLVTGGRLRITVLTFGQPLQPILPSIVK